MYLTRGDDPILSKGMNHDPATLLSIGMRKGKMTAWFRHVPLQCTSTMPIIPAAWLAPG
ncbi:MAG: hypothetical protein Q6365_016265 [Candidatus Sigynarchaeota archaeon]